MISRNGLIYRLIAALQVMEEDHAAEESNGLQLAYDRTIFHKLGQELEKLIKE